MNKDKQEDELNNKSFENKAIELLSKGEFHEAKLIYSNLLRTNPNTFLYHKDLAFVCISLNQSNEAASNLIKALHLSSNCHETYSNLGIVLKQIGEFKTSLLCHKNSILLNPFNDNYFYNMGNTLKSNRDINKSIRCFKKALELNPINLKCIYNMANALNEKGKITKSILLYNNILDLDPNYINARINLGDSYKRIGKIKEAILQYKRVLEIDSDSYQALFNLSLIYMELRLYNEAEEYLTRIDDNPIIKIHLLELANCYLNNKKYSQCRAILYRLINEGEFLSESFNLLGSYYLYRSDKYRSSFCYQLSIDLNTNNKSPYVNLLELAERYNDMDLLRYYINKYRKSELIMNEISIYKSRLLFRAKKFKEAYDLILRVSNKWLNSCSIEQRALYWNYRGHIEDRRELFQDAYNSFIKSKSYQFNLNCNVFSIHHKIRKYNLAVRNIKDKQLNIYKDEFNIGFIIGFPRSGTTLLDNILNAHPNIKVIDEQPLISALEYDIVRNYKTRIEDIGLLAQKELEEIRAKYINNIIHLYNDRCKLIIDKLPLNIISIPLIKLLFPQSKIIFSYRHPCDTIISCIQQLFEVNDAMVNLRSVEMASNLYNIINHSFVKYRETLNLNVIDCRYENLIYKYSKTVEQIIRYLDLPWYNELNVYNHNKSLDKLINTPSSSQVTQPLYSSSINKWFNYRDQINPSISYLSKWISHYGYDSP